jgi:hypothetical protein
MEGDSAEAVVRIAMETLAPKRPIYHSEADFQHALAWEVQFAHPGAAIRLEKRVAAEPSVELDLLVMLDERRLGIELKYPRRGMSVEVEGEVFNLATGADDHARYEAIKDIARLERLVAERIVDSGVLVLLTNVANVWGPPTSQRRVLYDELRIHEGRNLAGTIQWGDWGAEGGRPPGGPITLSGTYPLRWSDYSKLDSAEFRYLVVGVES